MRFDSNCLTILPSGCAQGCLIATVRSAHRAGPGKPQPAPAQRARHCKRASDLSGKRGFYLRRVCPPTKAQNAFVGLCKSRAPACAGHGNNGRHTAGAVWRLRRTVGWLPVEAARSAAGRYALQKRKHFCRQLRRRRFCVQSIPPLPPNATTCAGRAEQRWPHRRRGVAAQRTAQPEKRGALFRLPEFAAAGGKA
jgi:hypothetical protein